MRQGEPSVQMTQAQMAAILAALIAEDGPFDPAAVWVGVAVSVVNHGQQTVLADITQASTSVAVRQPITTWSTPYIEQDGRHVVQSTTKIFRPASDADATTVGIWYLASALTAGNLLGFGQMDAPKPLPDENYAVSVVVRLVVDPLGRWDATIVWNG